jgi:succinate-semialdehyde dehydrogenase/glutarate-semialdehyde dehydrogenase
MTSAAVAGTVGGARSFGSGRVTAALLEALAARVTTAGERATHPASVVFTGEPLGAVPLCTAQDVAAAAVTAREAQRDWADRPLHARGQVFLRFHDLVLRDQQLLLDLLQLETGKSRRSAFEEMVGRPSPRATTRAPRNGTCGRPAGKGSSSPRLWSRSADSRWAWSA